MTPEQRLTELLESVFVPTNVGVTIAAIEDALVGMPGASDAVIATFTAAQQPAEATVLAIAKAGRMQSAFIAMSSDKGLLLSTPERQAVIDELAVSGAWPDAVRDAVKALGGTYVKEWQRQGMAEAPTLSKLTKESIVTATRKAIENVLKPIQQKSTAINGWMDAADLDGYTEAELQAYCDGLLASSDGNGGGE